MTNFEKAYIRMNKNFMTPHVMKYEVIFYPINKIVELAKGTGLRGETIFGVSELVEGDTRTGLETTKNGAMFYTLKEAETHYKNLLKI